MTPFHATVFMMMYRVVEGFYQDFINDPSPKDSKWSLDKTIGDEDRAKFRGVYELPEQFCRELGLAASAATIKKMLACLEKERSTYRDFFTFGSELGGRLVDEMEERSFIALNGIEAQHYIEPLKGWDDALDKLPNLTDDVGEASRCFAFGRYSAAMFHTMRALELAVQALSAKLGIHNVEREWGKLLSDIGKAIEKMPTSKERNQWSEAHTLLYHVKQAWRNEVMHPKQTYTEEEAAEVIGASKSFCRHLANLI
jgi:HEPN domain-containing protein